MAAALELLLRLNSARSMCLNLLFSAEEVSTDSGGPVGWPVPVTLSCAFRLGQCARRLASELATADERWETTPRSSEGEVEAEEAIAAWLHVGELLVNLCQTVLVNCPTASVFLAVVLPGGLPPDTIDEAVLKGVLADLHTVLARITGRTQRAETVPLRAAALVGNLRALQRQLIDTKVDPPPATLTREELCPPRHAGSAEAGDAGTASASRAGCDALEDVVDLFDAAIELEGDSEWYSVTDLDAADAPAESARQDWEFDGAAHRKKRRDAIEKAEVERRAKRLKVATRSEKPDDRNSQVRRRASESEPPRNEKASKPRTTVTSSSPAEAPAKPTATSTATTAAAQPAQQATGGSGKAPDPSPAAAAKAPAATPKAAATAGEVADVAALQAFLKDHPQFLRVVQNPKKCLSDPRVKSMFLSELKNYPVVEAFLSAKGLVLT